MQSNWLREVSKTYSQLNEFFIPTVGAQIAVNATNQALQKAKNYDGSFGGAGSQEPKVVSGSEKYGVGNRRLESNRAIEAARGDGSFKGEKTASSTVGQERETVITPEGKKLSIIPAQQSGMYGGARFTGSRTVAGNAPATAQLKPQTTVAQRTREGMREVDMRGPRKPVSAAKRMRLSAAAKNTVANRKAARGIAPQEDRETLDSLASLGAERAPRSTVYGPERHWSRSGGFM